MSRWIDLVDSRLPVVYLFVCLFVDLFTSLRVQVGRNPGSAGFSGLTTAFLPFFFSLIISYSLIHLFTK